MMTDKIHLFGDMNIQVEIIPPIVVYIISYIRATTSHFDSDIGNQRKSPKFEIDILELLRP